jgi:predicted small secreted protein
MIMKRTLFVATLILIMVFFCISLTGCGTTKAAWKNDDVSTFSNGTKSESILERLGQPNRKYSSKGIQVWEYRKPAEASSGKNAYTSIGSLGFLSGADSAYVDILRFKIKNNRVVDVESEENVMGIIMPGSMTNQK